MERLLHQLMRQHLFLPDSYLLRLLDLPLAGQAPYTLRSHFWLSLN